VGGPRRSGRLRTGGEGRSARAGAAAAETSRPVVFGLAGRGGGRGRATDLGDKRLLAQHARRLAPHGGAALVGRRRGGRSGTGWSSRGGARGVMPPCGARRSPCVQRARRARHHRAAPNVVVGVEDEGVALRRAFRRAPPRARRLGSHTRRVRRWPHDGVVWRVCPRTLHGAPRVSSAPRVGPRHGPTGAPPACLRGARRQRPIPARRAGRAGTRCVRLVRGEGRDVSS